MIGRLLILVAEGWQLGPFADPAAQLPLPALAARPMQSRRLNAMERSPAAGWPPDAFADATPGAGPATIRYLEEDLSERPAQHAPRDRPVGDRAVRMELHLRALVPDRERAVDQDRRGQAGARCPSRRPIPTADAPVAIRDRRIVLARNAAGPHRDAVAPGLDQPARRPDRRSRADQPPREPRHELAADPPALAARRAAGLFRQLRLDRRGHGRPRRRHRLARERHPRSRPAARSP